MNLKTICLFLVVLQVSVFYVCAEENATNHTKSEVTKERRDDYYDYVVPADDYYALVPQNENAPNQTNLEVTTESPGKGGSSENANVTDQTEPEVPTESSGDDGSSENTNATDQTESEVITESPNHDGSGEGYKDIKIFIL